MLNNGVLEMRPIVGTATHTFLTLTDAQKYLVVADSLAWKR